MLSIQPATRRAPKGHNQTCKVRQLLTFPTCLKIACAALHQKQLGVPLATVEDAYYEIQQYHIMMESQKRGTCCARLLH